MSKFHQYQFVRYNGKVYVILGFHETVSRVRLGRPHYDSAYDGVYLWEETFDYKEMDNFTPLKEQDMKELF